MKADRLASVWPGLERPAPKDLVEEAYDAVAVRQVGCKILVCGTPRTSSTRLSRLMLAAGVGIPMEYWNAHNREILMRRRGLERRRVRKKIFPRLGAAADDSAYLNFLMARRSVNGIFSANIQYQHMLSLARSTRNEVFRNALVIHIERFDVAAQTASLACALLTKRYGFEEGNAPVHCDCEKMRKALRKANAVISEGNEGFDRFFARSGIAPIKVSDQTVNQEPRSLIEGLCSEIGRLPDREKLDRMIEIDTKYTADVELKSRLRDMIESDDAVLVGRHRSNSGPLRVLKKIKQSF
ncbi:MAG: hypothetical protein C0454_04425 [Parvibaculum sp.]|nr:hypothetical protein [Parvibaculum sp.]